MRRATEPASTYLTIGIASANCLFAMVAWMHRTDFATVSTLGLLSFAAYLLLLVRRLDNIYFLARTAFLGGVGYFPLFIKMIAGPDAQFSLYEASTQGLQITVIMYVATTLALLSNEIGLRLGTPPRIEARQAISATSAGLWRATFYASLPILAVVSLILIRVAPTVLTAQYTSANNGELPLGNTNSIGIICLLAMFVAAQKIRIANSKAILLASGFVFLVVAMFLRGLRQDVVTAMLGLAICYGLVRGRAYGIRLRNALVILVFVIIIELMGIARNLLAVGVSYGDMWALLLNEFKGSNGIYHVGTLSPIATTFANSIYLIQSGQVHHFMGQSYWDFIPRTPPEFLYPNRPDDLALLFGQFKLASGGGIFELAEAYLNFGILGALCIPGAISFLMAKAFFGALRRQTVLSYFLLFSFLGMFMRGTWYQTFAFYKCFVTAVILYFTFLAFYTLIRNASPDGQVAATTHAST